MQKYFKSLKIFFKDLSFYFSRRINRPLSAPDVLQISLTSRCNLKCTSCNVWKNPTSPHEELTLQEIKDLITESCLWGISELHLLGGEPFLREDLKEIVSFAKAKKMFVVICTNGTLINESLVTELAALKLDLINISLDGAKKETHDLLRGEQGSYDKIIAGIKTINRLKENHIPKVGLILTVSNKNLFELQAYIDLAESFSIHSIYFTALVADNVELSTKNKKHPLWIPEQELSKLDGYFSAIYSYAKNKNYLLDYPSFKLLAKYFKGELKKEDWFCFCGFKRLVVIPTGEIQICGKLIGNYKQTKSLKQLWYSEKAKESRKLVIKCPNYCLQDCHARAESNSFKRIITSPINKILKRKV